MDLSAVFYKPASIILLFLLLFFFWVIPELLLTLQNPFPPLYHPLAPPWVGLSDSIDLKYPIFIFSEETPKYFHFNF